MANSSVWDIDKIPERVVLLRQMLITKQSRPTVLYVHCTAGCDRTGEVVGSYRLKYHPEFNVTQMYALDVAECGRLAFHRNCQFLKPQSLVNKKIESHPLSQAAELLVHDGHRMVLSLHAGEWPKRPHWMHDVCQVQIRRPLHAHIPSKFIPLYNFI